MSLVQESEAAYVEVSLPPMAKENFDIEENKCYGSLKVAPLKNAAASDGNKSVVIASGSDDSASCHADSCCSCLLHSFCNRDF